MTTAATVPAAPAASPPPLAPEAEGHDAAVAELEALIVDESDFEDKAAPAGAASEDGKKEPPAAGKEKPEPEWWHAQRKRERKAAEREQRATEAQRKADETLRQATEAQAFVALAETDPVAFLAKLAGKRGLSVDKFLVDLNGKIAVHGTAEAKVAEVERQLAEERAERKRIAEEQERRASAGHRESAIESFAAAVVKDAERFPTLATLDVKQVSQLTRMLMNAGEIAEFKRQVGREPSNEEIADALEAQEFAKFEKYKARLGASPNREGAGQPAKRETGSGAGSRTLDNRLAADRSSPPRVLTWEEEKDEAARLLHVAD